MLCTLYLPGVQLQEIDGSESWKVSGTPPVLLVSNRSELWYSSCPHSLIFSLQSAFCIGFLLERLINNTFRVIYHFILTKP